MNVCIHPSVACARRSASESMLLSSLRSSALHGSSSASRGSAANADSHHGICPKRRTGVRVNPGGFVGFTRKLRRIRRTS